MASESVESEKLRKQIKFLEDLISSASTRNHVSTSKNQSSSGPSHLSHDGINRIRPHSYNKPYSKTTYNSRNNYAKYSWRKGETNAVLQQSYDRDINRRDTTSSLPRRNIDHTRSFSEGGEKRSSVSSQGRINLCAENKKNITEKAVPCMVQDKRVKDTKTLSNAQGSTQYGNKSDINRLCNNEQFRSLYKWHRNSEAVQNVGTYNQQSRIDNLNKTSAIVEGSTHFLTNQSKTSEQKTTSKKDNVFVSSSNSPPKLVKPQPSTNDSLLDVCKSKTAISLSSHPKDSVTNISSKHKSLCKDILKTQTKLLELKKSLIEKKTKSKLSQISQENKHFHLSHTNSLASRGKSKACKLSSIHSSTYKKPQSSGLQSYKKYTKYWNKKLTHQRSSLSYNYWRSYSSYIGSFTGKQRSGFSKYRTRVFPSYLLQSYGFAGRPFIQHYYYLKTPFYQRHQLRKQMVISKLNLRRRIEKHRRPQDQVIFDPKKKLDRRKTVVKPARQNFVMINGMLYKKSQKSLVKASRSSSKSTKDTKNTHQSGTQHKIKFLNSTAMKTVTVRGVKFKVDRDGKSLKKLETQLHAETNNSVSRKKTSVSRVDIGGVTYRQTKPGTLERVTTRKNRVIATRALNKSVVHATSKHWKNQQQNSSRKQQYCMFYNRFGKCNRRDKCPYIHDPDRIAICTRFLRGTCQIKACPFSHKVSAEKMPVCSYYLKGMCNKSDCPYLHVNVNRDAEICQDFVNGFCPLGKKCKKKHTLICPVFTKTGTCPDGKKCRLQHRKTRKVKQEKGDQSNTTESTSVLKDTQQKSQDSVQEDTCDIHLPFKERRLPAYISLIVKNGDDGSSTMSGTNNGPDTDTENLKIRPQFQKL